MSSELAEMQAYRVSPRRSRGLAMRSLWAVHIMVSMHAWSAALLAAAVYMSPFL